MSSNVNVNVTKPAPSNTVELFENLSKGLNIVEIHEILLPDEREDVFDDAILVTIRSTWFGGAHHLKVKPREVNQPSNSRPDRVGQVQGFVMDGDRRHEITLRVQESCTTPYKNRKSYRFRTYATTDTGAMVPFTRQEIRTEDAGTRGRRETFRKITGDGFVVSLYVVGPH